MAPKSDKRKGKGPSQPVERFVDKAARLRFEAIKLIPFIFERGFVMEKRAWSLQYAIQVKTLDWETLCHPRTEVIPSWVYEFYANARGHKGDVVTVRGKSVDFSPLAINELFELGNEEDDIATHTSVTLAEMAATLCSTPGPMWSSRSATSIESTVLSRAAKVWLLFVNASIMPTRHLNLVNSERIAIIYHILQGINFNVGRIITERIKQKIREDKVRVLWFPSLITELCRRAGVDHEEGELILPVKKNITETVVEINIKVGEESAHPKSNIGAQASSSNGNRKRVLIPSGEGAELSDLLDALEYLKAYLRCQHCYIRSRMDHFQKHLSLLLQKAKLPMEDPIFAYQEQFDTDGNLLDEDLTKLDPSEFVESDKEDAAASHDEDGDGSE